MPPDPDNQPRQALLAAGLTAALLALGLRRPARSPSGATAHRATEQGSGKAQVAGGGGLGRHADAPSHVPARGWWQVLKRVASEVSKDRLLTEAAGITFYAILAIFPALAALVSLYGLFADPRTVEQHVSAISGVVPGGGMQIISEQLNRVASQASGSLSFGFIIGLVISLWSANAATKALFDALNVVYEEKEKRSFIRFTAVTLLFTLGTILFVLLALAGIVVVPVVLGMLGLGDTLQSVINLVRWPLLLLAVAFLLALIYRFGPSRDNPKWRWVSWGSAFASIVWIAGSALFSWYVSNFGSYNETYGSLGAAIGFMTWIWLSATVVLIGGELNAELEHQTARDTTTGPTEPMGQRGARMADTVARRP